MLLLCFEMEPNVAVGLPESEADRDTLTSLDMVHLEKDGVRDDVVVREREIMLEYDFDADGSEEGVALRLRILDELTLTVPLKDVLWVMVDV